MKALGFGSVPCGPDGPDAWAVAEKWNKRWEETRTGKAPSPAMVSVQNLTFENSEELTVYPSRSLGEAFRKYRQTDKWGRKAPRTREDWWRGWERIKLVFGDVDPRTVPLDDVSAWRKAIEDTVSLREAHRALKIWRALWKVDAALGYCIRDSDPSLAVRNSAPPGRSAQWSEGEAVRLAKRAWRMGYYGLSGRNRGCLGHPDEPWRRPRLEGLSDGHCWRRDAVLGGMLSARSMRLLSAYLEKLGRR